MAQKLLRLTPPKVVRLVIIFAIIVAVIAMIGYYAGYYKASTGQHNQADLRATATSETTKRKDLAPAGTGRHTSTTPRRRAPVCGGPQGTGVGKVPTHW